MWHNYYTLELAGDTVIDGKTYKAMHKYSGDAINEMNDTIPVYLREEDKVVYGIVPDGKTYDECPVGMNWWPEAREVVQSGQEFILYDFNDPINFIKDNIKYPIQGSPNGYYVYDVIPDQIVVAGKKVNRYMYDASCIIEGIGCDGVNHGYPLSALSQMLCYVIEKGDTIYTSKSLEIPWDTGIDDEDYNRELPIPRQGVQWVNERVSVDNGDTTIYYYKYEFRGYDSQGFALDNIPFNKVKGEGRDMMYFGSSMGFGFLEMYHFHNYVTDIESCYTPNWYIYRQKEDFLNRENLIEVDPLIIEGVKCHRFAYIGEQGDTLAYIVQGIGFDSYDMGDLLTPFTRKPDPNADHQEWCGLSHVVKDGQVIYKGMRYREGAFDGIDEVATDKARHPMDDKYYNLMGQPVGKDVPTVPGIYIHQGKKIVVR